MYLNDGEKIGKLTVLKSEIKENLNPISGKLTKKEVSFCKCDCGNYKEVASRDLHRRKTSSCGCARVDSNKKRIHNTIGQTFGRLTVVEKIGHINRCQCSCGNSLEVPTSRLKFGTTKSCGCLQKEKASESMTRNLKKYRVSKGYDEDFLMTKLDKIERARFRRFRKLALDRDYYQCVLCNDSQDLQVHHIVPWSSCKESRFDLQNLVTLCEGCHKTVHNNNFKGDLDPYLSIILSGYTNEPL